METVEVQQPHRYEPDMILTQEAQYYLQQAGKWAVFLGIMGFIVCAFILLGALALGVAGPYLSHSPELAASAPYMSNIMPYLAGFYVVMAVVFFVFNLYLYQFGAKIKHGVAFVDNVKVTEAMAKLKSFFKFWGIITIVAIVLYIVFIGVLIAGGIGAASMLQR